ncbi:divalent-cation tolerance protein CutA [Gemmatimonas aurantiaca]|uniref:divalent-cation tolerance protein CutA n=1 Tax=Gemmatimonas aurantiaca TaxID=173480 RepID=UPI00301D6D04
MDSPTLSDNSRGTSQERPVVLALTTWPANGDPGMFAQALLEARLVACVSMLPGMRSLYRWQGRIEENAEILLLLKTTADRVPLLREHMVSHHPYEVPELLVFPAGDGLPAYLDWVRGEVA